MNEAILKKLEQKLNRRSFLRGSTLAAAAIVGRAASPLMAFAQDKQQDENKKPDENKKAEKEAEGEGEKDQAKSSDELASGQNPKETLKDSDGREYRVCPQCGSNMYRQERIWTCDNCGYSYVE